MRRISILDLYTNCVISCVCLHSPLAFQTDVRRGLAIGLFGDEHRDEVYECAHLIHYVLHHALEF